MQSADVWIKRATVILAVTALASWALVLSAPGQVWAWASAVGWTIAAGAAPIGRMQEKMARNRELRRLGLDQSFR